MSDSNFGIDFPEPHMLMASLDNETRTDKQRQEMVNEVLEKWFEGWLLDDDLTKENRMFAGEFVVSESSASAFYYFFEHAAEILADIKKVGG